MKTAEEVAREMVRALDGGCSIEDGDMFVTSDLSTVEIDQLRGVIARLIERSRAEGAAAERERLAAHAGRPAEAVAAEMVKPPCGGDAYVRLDELEAEFRGGFEVEPMRDILARPITRERAAARADLEAEVARLRAELATSEERRAKWESLATEAVNRYAGAALAKVEREAAYAQGKADGTREERERASQNLGAEDPDYHLEPDEMKF
jgi:hypothetical protein